MSGKAETETRLVVGCVELEPEEYGELLATLATAGAAHGRALCRADRAIPHKVLKKAIVALHIQLVNNLLLQIRDLDQARDILKKLIYMHLEAILPSVIEKASEDDEEVLH